MHVPAVLKLCYLNIEFKEKLLNLFLKIFKYRSRNSIYKVSHNWYNRGNNNIT